MIFIDTNIFMYAAGIETPQKARCLKFLEKIARSKSAHDYCINTEVLQEILHRYRSINKSDIGFQLFDLVLNLGLVVHPIELSDLSIARRILREHPDMSTRDAVHLGVSERRNIPTIITFDRDFSRYPGINAVEPG